jgi:anti-anti-sigma factor
VLTEPPEPPVVEATVTADAVTVVLSGDFDVVSEGLLTGPLERICRARPRRLIFDAAQVTFMDCASARLIAGSARWLPAGTKPVISRPSPTVRRVLQVSGIGRLCELRLPADGPDQPGHPAFLPGSPSLCWRDAAAPA